MASAIKSLGFIARASAYRLPSGVRRARRIAPFYATSQSRAFAVTPARPADDDESSNATDGSRKPTEMTSEELTMKVIEDMAEAGYALPESEVETYKALTRAADEGAADPSNFYGGIQRDMETGRTVREFSGIPRNIIDEEDLVQVEARHTKGFFAEDEGAEDMDEDDEFEPDDISSNAHLELEQVRELREFARVMAWDMPLLYDHRKPFEAPTKEQPLRFRYTTYLGEHHPASKKVILDFSPSALPNLTPVQRSKLIKLLGPRYNPQTDIAKMSSEHHPTPAQNKRHLATTLDALLKECREGKDTFEDVPLDFRHHREKIIHKFPEEWKMTDERKLVLEQARSKRLEATQLQVETGESVDGRRIIERMLAGSISQVSTQQKEPVRVAAGTGGRGGVSQKPAPKQKQR
ncbi:hypothetical protein FH972_022456 [Carpinus fangiana]|uniref:Small ribosomal subunit protein mS35 mitochondrial conserved domain-containing protein n=1 Tax=Carpinus fangiana TaxID=176857 RepID=A0A5N6KSB6_9ROSI|nr:hypothetical protein FH972_022456 [Carpinus fangiana]